MVNDLLAWVGLPPRAWGPTLHTRLHSIVDILKAKYD